MSATLPSAAPASEIREISFTSEERNLKWLKVWGICSSGMLHGVDWWSVTDVSGQSMGTPNSSVKQAVPWRWDWVALSEKSVNTIRLFVISEKSEDLVYSAAAAWSHTYVETWLIEMYEGWNFNSGNYLFTTDTK